jgi:hypothetical protein
MLAGSAISQRHLWLNSDSTLGVLAGLLASNCCVIQVRIMRCCGCARQL